MFATRMVADTVSGYAPQNTGRVIATAAIEANTNVAI
jgi:hypothetical protein